MSIPAASLSLVHIQDYAGADTKQIIVLSQARLVPHSFKVAYGPNIMFCLSVLRLPTAETR